MKKGINRRNFIGYTSAAIAAIATMGTGSIVKAAGSPIISLPNKDRKRSLRVAHLTDIHVQPQNPAPKAFAQALNDVQNMKDRPDFILTGGDAVMDASSTPKDKVKKDWEVWHSTLKNECSLPLYHCIGNHDIFGWTSGKQLQKYDPLFGKQWALEEFGLKNRYYSFDQAGWHFIVLDSLHHKPFGYYAKLDDEQFDWLKTDVEKTPGDKWICVLSHIPILSLTTFFDGNNEKKGDWHVGRNDMHIDARKIKDLFYKHKNVKICLSGHIHLQDQAEYLGVKYLCNGAVCGAWWGGNNQEFPPAYAIVDLYDDGSTESEFIPYKWQ